MRFLHLVFCCALVFCSCALSAQDAPPPTYGCNDETACNYNTGGYDVNSGCLYDGDFCTNNSSDELALYTNCNCVPFKVGCMDDTACNYDSLATFQSDCLYPGSTADNCWICSELIGSSEYWGEGQGVLVSNDMNNNGTCDEYDIIGCTSQTNLSGINHYNYDSLATALNLFNDGSTPCAFIDPSNAQDTLSFAGILDDEGNPFRLAVGTQVYRDTADFDGDNNRTEFGSPNTNPWEILEADKVTLEYDSTGLPTNGLTVHPAYVKINGDTDGNGTSDFNEIEGCMDELACNYNAAATIQPADVWDEVAEEWVYECKTQGECGCNGAEPLGIEAGKCDCAGSVADALSICGGSCNSDDLPAGGNGICDSDDVEGCMNEDACNFNIANTYQNGTDAERCNFPSDECGCLFTGIQGNDSLTYTKPVLSDYTDAVLESGFVIDSICDCRGAVADAIGICRIVHPLIQNGNAPQDPDFCFADSNGNGVCDDLEIEGCTDNTACNFQGATLEDNSCRYYNQCGECLAAGEPSSIVGCDCAGNELDICGVCAGPGQTQWYQDLDSDGYGNVSVSVMDCPNADGTGALNYPGYIKNAADCNDTDSSVGAPDECGECGGSGGGYVFGVRCGCEPWGSFEEDGSCGCTETAPFIKIYPSPGRDCYGACINGTDEDGLCIILSAKEVTTQPEVYSRQQTESRMVTNTDVFAMERWMANIDTLHSRMSKNLDDGSYGGYSDTLTIEKAIINNGTFNSRGEARIGGDYLVVPDPAAAPLVDSVYFFQDPVTGEWDIPIYTVDTNADGDTIYDDEGNPRTTQLEETPSQYKDSVSINSNLFVGGRLRVKGSTFSDGGINTTSLKMEGDLTVGGSLTVKGESDQWGNAIMQDSLWVRKGALTVGLRNNVILDTTGHISASDLVLTDSLHVAGETTIGGSAILSDGLIVNTKQSDLKKPSLKVHVDGTNAITTINSMLNVNGETTLSNGFTVSGGNSTFKGTSAFDAQVNMNENVNIAKKLEVGGTTDLNSLNVANLAHLGNKLFVGGPAKGTPGYQQYGLGLTTAQSSPNWPEQEGQDDANGNRYSGRPYQMVVDASGAGNAGYNGVLVRLAIDEQYENFQNGNNFVTFQRWPSNKVAGRIEGETVAELPNNGGYAADQVAYGLDRKLLLYDLGKAGYDLYGAIKTPVADIAEAVAAAIPGAGLTDSDVAESIANGVKAGVEFVSVGTAIGDLVRAAVDLVAFEIAYNAWISDVRGAIGVTYASGAGDYAEWIEKENHRMDFLPGEVVGVRAGLVSYDTENSDHNLVISTKPIMLGNEIQGDMRNYEKVAFMGQVPIRIQGVVHKGDYILPTGDKNGYAKAVPRDEIRFDEIPNIVGVAWEDGSESYFNTVNCSVGLDRSGSAQLVDIIEAELEQIRQSMSNEIALNLVESGLISSRRAKRVKKRNMRNNLSKPTLIQTPNLDEVKTENVAEISKVPTTVAEITPASLGLPTTAELYTYIASELLDLREELMESMHANPVVSAQTIAMQSRAIIDGFEQVLAQDFTGNGELPLDPAYSGARDVVRPYAEKLMASITEKVVNTDNFESLVQQELLKAGKENPTLLKAYPPGSNAQHELTEKIVGDALDAIKNIDPNVGKYLPQN